jgi:hypothetical protein
LAFRNCEGNILGFRGFLEQLEREGKKARTCKMGLDATIPLKGTGKGFKKEESRKGNLNKFL